jgi:hypothetical protein
MFFIGRDEIGLNIVTGGTGVEFKFPSGESRLTVHVSRFTFFVSGFSFLVSVTGRAIRLGGCPDRTERERTRHKTRETGNVKRIY